MYTTRIAPSPTGDMHIGTARTAYFNWLAARATGGKFILRIDDTDADRNKPQVTEDIYDVMSWLGLDADEVYRQTDRKEAYADALASLTAGGFIRNDDGAFRFVLPASMDISWGDEIAGLMPQTDTVRKQVDGMVLFRSDRSAIYHTASVVDDVFSRVNFIIRGTDHITNTFKQVAIFKALGGLVPKMAHVGLLTQNRKKLSKRDGAASMLSYKQQNYHPEAVLNFMLRMGWGPTVDDKSTALIPRARALELFLTGGRMRGADSALDPAKLASFDRKYKALEKANEQQAA